MNSLTIPHFVEGWFESVWCAWMLFVDLVGTRTTLARHSDESMVVLLGISEEVSDCKLVGLAKAVAVSSPC